MLQWKDLPVEIQKAMLDEKFKQTGSRNPDRFIWNTQASTHGGGFNWGSSKDGSKFWRDILHYNNLEAFFNKYPTKLVSNIKLNNKLLK
jgi:hypothetical protein